MILGTFFLFPIVLQINAFIVLKPEEIRGNLIEIQQCYVGDIESNYSQNCLQIKKREFPLLIKYIF